MPLSVENIILSSIQAQKVKPLDVIQELWSGYGVIQRYEVMGTSNKHVIVKHVRFPNETNHPRGWNTSLSHERKVKSYAVETYWYQNYSQLCNDLCRVPKLYGVENSNDEVVIVLEDIDEEGFHLRYSDVSLKEMHACLSWLAHFHAMFMNKDPEGLWPIGTYWHLDTRPEELQELDDARLKEAAYKLDAKLNGAQFKTFVHGDAKLANFCFNRDSTEVAAVDFQYVGGGCGMKDVAYFIGSCLHEDECQKYEQELLDYYFELLHEALKQYHPHMNSQDIEKEWRSLFYVAWSDFHRFIKGWSPGHWKIHTYSEHITQKVIDNL